MKRLELSSSAIILLLIKLQPVRLCLSSFFFNLYLLYAITLPDLSISHRPEILALSKRFTVNTLNIKQNARLVLRQRTLLLANISASTTSLLQCQCLLSVEHFFVHGYMSLKKKIWPKNKVTKLGENSVTHF